MTEMMKRYEAETGGVIDLTKRLKRYKKSKAESNLDTK